MKIGIIGAGQIGGTLTRRLTALGHTKATKDTQIFEIGSDFGEPRSGGTIIEQEKVIKPCSGSAHWQRLARILRGNG